MNLGQYISYSGFRYGGFNFHVCGFLGKKGSGKTLHSLKLALEICARRGYGLVSNLKLNCEAIHNYCSFKGRRYDNLKAVVDSGRIHYIPVDKDESNLFSFLFRYPWCVILIDELGLIFDSRKWSRHQGKSHDDFKNSLALVRHMNCMLLWTAQYPNQVDSVVRGQSDVMALSYGSFVYDNKLKRPHLFWRSLDFYEGDTFWSWIEDKDRLNKPLKKFVKRQKSWWGIIGIEYHKLFNIYNSLDLVRNKEILNR